MTRYRPLVLGVLITAAAGSILTGMPVGLLAVAGVSVAAGVMPLLFRRAATPDFNWTPTTPVFVGSLPARARHEPHGPSNSRSVIRAIGRFESAQLATSPWFGVGVGFCVIIIVAFAVVYDSDEVHLWPNEAMLAPWFAHPLVGMSILAVHRNITRDRRDATDELLDTCPTEPTTRTLGHIATSVVPVAAYASFCATYLAILLAKGNDFDGPPGLEQGLGLFSAFVLCIGGVTLGVALGRWVHFGLAPIVAVVAVLFLTLGLATQGDPGWNPLAELSTMPPLSEMNAVFTARPAMWHLLWLLALAGSVAAVGLARHRRDRGVIAVATVSIALAVISGIGATRPMSDSDADTIAERITNPAAHQSCVTGAGGRLDVCTFDDYGDIAAAVLEPVSAVVAALPAEVGTLTMRQRFPQDATLADLPPEVRRRIPGGLPSLGPNEVSLDFGTDDDTVDGARFDAAFTATGLPIDSPPDDMPRVIAGQARGVVALWLATRGMPRDDARELATAFHPDAPEPFDRGLAWHEECTSPPVVWSAQDLQAARALTALDNSDITRVLATRWERWIDPRTSTDDLLAALGLPPVGPFDDVRTRVETLGC